MTMDKFSINKLIKKFKDESKKIKAGDPVAIANAKQHLINAGIITPTGRLTKYYRVKTEKVKEKAEKFKANIEKAHKRTAGSKLNFR